MGYVKRGILRNETIEEFMRIHNRAEKNVELLFANDTSPYYPVLYDLGEDDVKDDDILLGYDIHTGNAYYVSFKLLFSRSIGLIGKTRSGKTTLGVRLLYELLKKQAKLKMKILDPEDDVFGLFKDPRVEHINVSDYSRYEKWMTAAEVFQESIDRPLAKDDPNLEWEVILVEEAIDFAPEGGKGLGHLDDNEKAALHLCKENYEILARRGIKRKTILISILQSPFLFAKSVLRQIGTYMVFKLGGDEVRKIPNLWLMKNEKVIEKAPAGLCHFCGEGCPQEEYKFHVAEVENLRTSDMR